MGNLIVAKSKWTQGTRVRVIGNGHGIDHYFPWATEEVVGILEEDVDTDGNDVSRLTASVITEGYMSVGPSHNRAKLFHQYVSIIDLEVLDDDE